MNINDEGWVLSANVDQISLENHDLSSAFGAIFAKARSAGRRTANLLHTNFFQPLSACCGDGVILRNDGVAGIVRVGASFVTANARSEPALHAEKRV